MKIVIGFIAGCVFGLVATAVAVETSDLGRYQSSSAGISAHWIYVTTFDTTTGRGSWGAKNTDQKISRIECAKNLGARNENRAGVTSRFRFSPQP